MEKSARKSRIEPSYDFRDFSSKMPNLENLGLHLSHGRCFQGDNRHWGNNTLKACQASIWVWHWKKSNRNSDTICCHPICCQDMASQPWFGLQSIGNKIQKRFTSNISRYLWRNLFHFSKLRWLVGFPFYSIYSIFKLISKKKLNLHIYLLIEFELEVESKFEIIRNYPYD